jgi:maltose alpha-D-glucosyltransferase / alpha-amylase
MFAPAVSDLWWKNAVVYCLDVETFMDADGNGIGEFSGLTQRLPYLAGLGVTCVWLLPFYPTPNRDDGYDVADYYAVDERLGTLGDFVEFMRTATDLGIRVVIDLVVNHTSVDHPWFQSSRSSRDSPYRDWYVWVDERPAEELDIIFPDQESSNWEYDEQAGQYYLHRFYASQPDLNLANPAVRDELSRIMGFWVQLGVAGFRVDAAPYLIGATGVEGQMPQDPHDILREMRSFLSRRRGDAVLFGEVNLDAGEREAYFGDNGDQMTGMFDFLASGALFASLAREDATPLRDQIDRTATPPGGSQWLHFVRNHDELNLSRVPEDWKTDVMDAFAPQESMRMYGRGIRRRLPPMLDGDARRVELAYSLLLTLPGTPVLFYGEEIGMGENPDIPGRRSVRSPMQWSDRENAGFSRVAPQDLIRPVVSDGPFRYEQVNVTDQRRQEGSLLNRISRGIAVRKTCPEFGWGTVRVVDAGDARVLAHRCDWLEGTVIAVHNLCGESVDVRLDLEDGEQFEHLTDVFGSSEYDPVSPDEVAFSLPPYSYRWMRARRPGSGLPL